ncbi:MAG: sugar phosphate isomerase/epimerase [Verrucomicrobia bacterium]|nr:MAG: sugar phosphate isomerase/epimerase [Verrucomicrobiota bacterium]
MLAFSTCWNNSRHADGEPMIEEIVAMGFYRIELSHGMTIAKLPGIQKAFRRGIFKCAGVHNYFPAPVEVMIDAPDAYEFTSHRAFDRQRAMDMTLRTLEVAADFQAHYLVLHMGSVPLSSKKFTRPLTASVASGQQRDPKHIRQKLDFIRKRERIAGLYFERATQALEKIAERAQELGVKLAIESRSRFEDMPTEREMLALQEQFKEHAAVGYWHDFGHVQLKHNLGLLDHHQWLESISNYLIGGHVHDVEWPARDHRTPLTGTLDFASLLAFFPKDAPLIWELSPTNRKADILSAYARWKELFPDRQ